MRAALGRVPAPVWALLGASLLLVPGLGRFGVWEPWESDLAARAVAPAGALSIAGVGYRVIGGEAGMRAGFAAAAVVTAAVVAWAGAGLFGTRAGLLAAAVLVSFPLFDLQARQLTSDMPLVLGLALSVGGLGRFVWGPRSPVALLVAGAGLALGCAAGGALVGVLAPCTALVGAVAIERPAGLGRTGRALVGGAAVASVALLVALAKPVAAGVPSWLLGGVPRLGPSAHTFEVLVRQAGFGLYPWAAVAVFALGRPLADDDRPAGVGLFLLLVTTFVLAIGTLRAHLLGEARFVALAPVALAVGAFLDRTIADDAGPEPILVFGIAVGTLLVARDLYLQPEDLLAGHVLGAVQWPVQVAGRALLLGTGVAFAGTISLALAWRRSVLLIALLVPLGAAAALCHVLVPALSRHLSRRALVDAWRSAARGELLALYHVPPPWYAAGGPTLSTTTALASYLGRSANAFALAPSDELADIDEAIASAGGRYAALEVSSRLVLLTSAHPAQDVNPLRAGVWMAPSPSAQPPWPAPRVRTTAVFGGAVELLGADFPTVVRRPGSLPLTLLFRVLRRPPPGYGIFVHLEGEALVNGDHQPLEGVFPTAHWLPGEYVRDQHAIDLPLALTAAGHYRLLAGLWPGASRPRLPITAGTSDGADRCLLGVVTVR